MESSIVHPHPLPRRARSLALLVFFQMLPATLVIPAIRPLFAAFHGGNEGSMHAFSALNMLGAAFAAPMVGRMLDRGRDPRPILTVLAMADGVLLLTISCRIPTFAVLALRCVEGGAHVGAATVLLAEMAGLGRQGARGRVMGLAGAAIIFAIALGNTLGSLLIAVDSRAPLWVGGVLAVGIAACAARTSRPAAIERRSDVLRLGELLRRRELLVPLGAAFVGRFTVGCIVVTFALFAHRVHGLGDSHIGLLFSALTLSFAVFMYPAARMTERLPPAFLLLGGGAGYGLVLHALGHVPAVWLVLLMFAAGICSALLFATTLNYAAQAREDQRGSAMAWVNAAGALGMLIGPAVAGITCGVLASKQDPGAAYRAVFHLAGGSVVLWLLLGARWLFRMGAMERRAQRGAGVVAAE
ncbi:MAG: MFS transporter [Polyangiaceae bacterium]